MDGLVGGRSLVFAERLLADAVLVAVMCGSATLALGPLLPLIVFCLGGLVAARVHLRPVAAWVPAVASLAAVPLDLARGGTAETLVEGLTVWPLLAAPGVIAALVAGRELGAARWDGAEPGGGGGGRSVKTSRTVAIVACVLMALLVLWSMFLVVLGSILLSESPEQAGCYLPDVPRGVVLLACAAAGLGAAAWSLLHGASVVRGRVATARHLVGAALGLIPVATSLVIVFVLDAERAFGPCSG